MFVSACGLDKGDETFTTPEFYIFDELDDLNYARALVRSDATPAVLNAASYYSGCHMLVVTTGDSLSGISAPVDFARNLPNPLAVQVGHEMDFVHQREQRD